MCDTHPERLPAFLRPKTLRMSAPQALEAAHNAIVTKYTENEVTIRSLQRTLHEDIIPNVLDEMNEEGVQYNMQDLEDWANDIGMNV